MSEKNSIILLIADDDLEDRMLIKDALEESRLINEIFFVENGEELMEYLHHKGKYSDLKKYPNPGLILLDLNMPKKDGREVLKEMKSDAALKHIPVVILTTSKAEEDIIKTYDLGVNSFITKPVSFNALVDIMKSLSNYWFNIVELPVNKNNG